MVKIKFGIFLDPIYLPLTYKPCKSIALKSEQLGYNAVWMSDHLMMGREPILECFTVLSALSSITDKLRLGSLVFCNSYRTPSLLAKMAATLDVISEGRLEFGIGAGWKEDEYSAYCIPFPKLSVRISQMKEGIEVIKEMWTKEEATYKGKYFRIRDAFCEPKPFQKPHPPITIGGSGEKLILRVVAKHANRSNWGSCSSETFKRKLKILRDHCSVMNRDYEQIDKSILVRVAISKSKVEIKNILEKMYSIKKPTIPFKEWLASYKASNIIGTPIECSDRIREYIDVGATYFMLHFLDSPTTKGMELFAKEVTSKL